MNAVSMRILDVLLVLFDTLGNVFKQKGIRKIDHVVEVERHGAWPRRYIRNTNLRNRFQTATATAANTHGTHNNRTSAQAVHNRMHVVHMLVVCSRKSC